MEVDVLEPILVENGKEWEKHFIFFVTVKIWRVSYKLIIVCEVFRITKINSNHLKVC